MRLPLRTTGVGWHTKTHAPHPHRHHDISDRLFFMVYYEAVVQHTYVIVFLRVCTVVYRLRGTTTRNYEFSGTGVVVGTNASIGGNRSATCQISREDGTIFLWWFLVRSLFFHCMPAGRHADSTIDSRRVRMCSRLPSGSQGAGSTTAVVCGRVLVSGGNGKTLML